MIRAFIAVELSDARREQIRLVQNDLKDRINRASTRDPRIAWVRPASMHLTLKFLGDIDERRVGALREAIATAIRGREPIAIPLARLGVFPRPREPRAFWIGPPEDWRRGKDADRLTALAGAIEDGCEAEGIPREPRPFAPHLTLARIKAGERQAGRALAVTGALDTPLILDPLTVDAVALMKSQLNADGAVHTRLWEIRLGAVS